MDSKVTKKKSRQPVKDRSRYAIYERDELLRRIGHFKGALIIISKSALHPAYHPGENFEMLRKVAQKCLDEDEAYNS